MAIIDPLALGDAVLEAYEGAVWLTADSTLYTADDNVTRVNSATILRDVAAFSGTVLSITTGTLAATESADAAAFAGLVGRSGTLAAAEASDTAAFTGVAHPVGTLAAVEGGAPAAWDTVLKQAITLSNANLTATVTGAGGVLGVGSISSSKVYWEQTVTTWANNNTAVGLAQANVNLGTVTSNTTRAATMGRTGAISINNVGTGVSLGTRANGNVIGIAVDPVAKLIWFRVAPAGNWNNSGTADPATGAGGLSISVLTLPLFPLFCGLFANDACTANFGASAFSGAVPSGFAAGLNIIVGDTAAFTGTAAFIPVTGTLAVTESADTAAFTGSVSAFGILAATEARDTAAFSGGVVVAGTLAATEDSDVADLNAVITNSGTFDAIEAPDIADFPGVVAWQGTMAATEAGPDFCSIVGLVVNSEIIQGELRAYESIIVWFTADSTVITADSTMLTADMEYITTGSFDTASFAGFVGPVVTGELAATEDSDTASFASSQINGILAATEGADTAAFTVFARPGITGVLAAVEGTSDTAFFTDAVLLADVDQSLRNEVRRTLWLAGQGGRVTRLENEVEDTSWLQNLNPEVISLENEVLRITELRP